jgi:hypothetical protein
MGIISSLAEALLASQEELCSRELDMELHLLASSGCKSRPVGLYMKRNSMANRKPQDVVFVPSFSLCMFVNC